jgi:hypothetical protein
MVWLPLLPNLTLDSPSQTGAVLHPPKKKLKHHHFKMFEAMELKIVTSRSSSMA